jgi:D-ornithine 4,5-aminomutase subunit beta
MAWKVMPELLVQHAINSNFSVKAGMKKENIALSTVPPVVSPTPEFKLNFIYALTLRELFKGFKFRAQMNTRYIESDLFDATRVHVLDTLISRLTSVDVQSTITPDEGRNVPWHVNSVRGIETAKHTLIALDGIKDILKVNDEYVRPKMRELKMRAILMMEEILEIGGYFEAVEQGFFVDNGYYPERNGDGIARKKDGGIGAGSVVPRDEDYMAPVCEHFGKNNLPDDIDKPCDLIDGCTLHNPDKIQYIDELDETDNVEIRMKESEKYRKSSMIKPEVEWAGDGVIQIDLTIPEDQDYAEAAAIAIAKKLGLEDPTVLNKTPLHPKEGTYIELKAKVPFEIDKENLELPQKPDVLPEEDITKFVSKNPMHVVAGTVGNDEHSVGLREILDIKHSGIEKFGIKYTYLGTSVPPEKFIDAAIEIGADAILVSTIITHNEVHVENMKKIHQLAIEKGIRDKIMIIAGGTQISNELAVNCGMDAGFGRGTKGVHVATFLVKKKKEQLKKGK